MDLSANPKVIVTGGTGFIGRRLVERLLVRGADVWVLSRHPETARLPKGIKAVTWDARTPEGWEPLVEQADAIVNLAGENIGSSPWSPERRKRILESRVNSGTAIVEAVATASRRPEVLLQASAVGYYGPRGDETVTEEMGPGQDFLAHVALAWEDSTRPVETTGMRRVVTRSGLVMDAHESALPRMALPFKLWVGGRLGSGRQWVPWIHIQDEVEAMIHLLEDENARGVYNLAAPEPVRNAEFGRVLARVLHRPYWLPVPAFTIRLLLGRMSTLVLDGQRVIPRRLEALGYTFKYSQLQPALEAVYGKT